MAYRFSISIRLKTRLDIPSILKALEPVGIYPDEDDLYREGPFSYLNHHISGFHYSKERMATIIQALMKLEPERSGRPQLKCMDDLAMRVWGYVITPDEAIPYRGVMQRERRESLCEPIPRVYRAGSGKDG